MVFLCGPVNVVKLGRKGLVPFGTRSFSAVTEKLVRTLQAEAGKEEADYKQAKEIEGFAKSSGYTFVEEVGNMNMSLERDWGNNIVKFEWQAISPYVPEVHGVEVSKQDDKEVAPEEEKRPVEFSVTVRNKVVGSGMKFSCTTESAEDHRFVIDNVRSYPNLAEGESSSGYDGPDFEDLDV